MKRLLIAAAGASLLATLAPVASQADSISSVEGARARERAGYRLTPEDREQLRRYGSNDDYGWRGYRDDGYYDGAYSGGGVSIYIGPRYGYGRYGY